MEQSNNLTIDKKFKIKKDTLENINKFKEFVGPEKFEMVLYGIDNVEIPLEEEKFDEMLNVLLEEEPKEKVTFSEAGEIAGFFCKPFAGTRMKQAAFTLNGISSLLQKLDPVVLRTLMESGLSPKQSGTSIDVSSLQKETQNPEKESIDQKIP